MPIYVYIAPSIDPGGITELNEETLRILPPYTLGQTIGEVVHYIALEGVTEEQVQSFGIRRIRCED